jgi:uncharacterized RDD family membrane protein YckC
MLPENRSFMVRGEDGQEYGPVDVDELRDWVRENRAGLGTEVRREDPGAAWNPWQNYPELVAMLAEVHATNPVAGSPPDLGGLAVAPLLRRLAAMIADLILFCILFVPIVSLLGLVYPMDTLSQAPLNPTLLQSLPPEMLRQLVEVQMISNGCLALYFTGFTAAHGQTPGKALMRLRVVQENGQKPTILNSFLRAIVLIFSIGLLFVPLAYVLINPQRRALHDLFAGTYVVEA